MSTPPFAQQVLADTDYWARFLADEWGRDFPDAAPATKGGWRGDFETWLAETSDNGERSRTTHAMRKLRRTSPREYEVAYRAMILGESFEQIAAWLNERAIRNDIPLDGREIHYTVRDAVALFLAGVEAARAAY